MVLYFQPRNYNAATRDYLIYMGNSASIWTRVILENSAEYECDLL